MNHFYSQNLYGAFFYCEGLDQAREIYQQLRTAVDSHPVLGAEVSIRIKRGCSPFEVHCGPSNCWTFQEGLVELEEYLLPKFLLPEQKKEDNDFAILMHWIEIAYAIGDNTYLEFTRGRRVYPETVSYNP
ncbi:hypothetical protein CCP3SC1_2030004 [Gammaproteobacteria bacterium]